MFKTLSACIPLILFHTTCFAAEEIKGDCAAIKDSKKRLICYDQKQASAKTPIALSKAQLDPNVSKDYLSRMEILFSQCDTTASIERMNVKFSPNSSLSTATPVVGQCTSMARREAMAGLDQAVLNLGDTPEMATALKEYIVIWQSIMSNNFYFTESDRNYERRLGDAKDKLGEQKIRLRMGLKFVF